MIRAVSFDAMRTLIHPRAPIGETYTTEAARFGLRVDSPQRIGESFVKAFRHFEKADPCFGYSAVELPLVERQKRWWTRVVSATFTDSIDGASPAKLAALCEHLYESFGHAAAWRLEPEAATTLAYLRRKGIRLAILSNFDSRLVQSILAEFGLRDMFDAVLLSGELGMEKTTDGVDRRIFELLARSVGCTANPAELLHVGDDVKRDYRNAKRAGMRALLLRDPTRAWTEGDDVDRADVIASLAEVKRFV